MLLTNYILKKCAFNTFVMLLSFTLLFMIFTILGQAGDIGKGDFNTTSMLFYVLLQLPGFLYLLLPLAILIGVMVGMLGLVTYSEFAVMRTSGISLKKILSILLAFGVSCAVITFVFGEVVAPSANSYAQIYKKNKTHEVVSNMLKSGVWSKDGSNTFVNIKQILPGNIISGLSVYEYDDELHLKRVILANNAKFSSNNNWILDHASIIIYESNHAKIKRQEVDNFILSSAIEPKYFKVLIVAPEDMSAMALLKYISHLEYNHQATNRYRIAFWGKLLYPLSCITMALIALAFIPNNRRSINLGAKLFLGILIGVAFFFVTRMLGFVALLFNLNPIITSLSPNILLLSFGWYFVLRKE